MTGSAGQIGRALHRLLPGAHFMSHSELDVADEDSVRDRLTGYDCILHLAAVTNVDLCEADPDLARRVNAQGTRIVETHARESGTRVVYLSTDYVFDGRKDGEYEEDDDTRPINEYGRTKLEGERSVAQRPENLIIRTSRVVGEGSNFVDRIVALAHDRPSLAVVDDQYGRPSFAMALAPAINRLLESQSGGIVHLAGSGEPCSWADLAEQALTLAGVETRVERISTDEYRARMDPSTAPRPANSTLSLDRARGLELPLEDWSVSLAAHLRRRP